MAVAPRYEYRLRWQRYGRAPATAIMQRERDVLAKAERLRSLDVDKREDSDDGRNPFAGMPDLIRLDLERRPVGEWEATRVFDLPEPDPDYGDDDHDDGFAF